MDLLTHGFLPYAAFTWARRPNRERVAAAVGGFAPDIDTLFSWTAHYDEHLYPFVHRGVSHSLVGAPVYALLVFLLLGLPVLRRRWPRFAAFAPGRDVLHALALGAFSHLMLDMTTITGVPLLWPFALDRVTAGWFFFSVPYLIIISLVFWIPILRGRATDRWVKIGGAVVLVVLLAVGGLRAATYPHGETEGATVTPGTNDWTWVLSRRNETGVQVRTYAWGDLATEKFFAEPNRTAAAGAIDACLEAVGARAWVWNLWGLPVADSRPRPEGGWAITLRDSVRLSTESRASSLFGSEDDRALRCIVDAEGHISTQRRAGFWG